ncbi:hypothetical protein NDU88_010948 [Pleurodeles waltl]|uniref:Uncharacterized protein n=1 Tax=Pleurodeles waltl TaxID=8319 RepID=A0AAV7QVT0_PLEWA|nr:hypothetical protein NDU88_010948 [Pleurodeles waltl]
MAPPRLTPSSPGPRRRAASVARSAPPSRVRPLGLPSSEQDLRARAAAPGESAAEAAAAGTLAARPTRRGRSTAPRPHLGTPATLAGRPGSPLSSRRPDHRFRAAGGAYQDDLMEPGTERTCTEHDSRGLRSPHRSSCVAGPLLGGSGQMDGIGLVRQCWARPRGLSDLPLDCVEEPTVVSGVAGPLEAGEFAEAGPLPAMWDCGV